MLLLFLAQGQPLPRPSLGILGLEWGNCCSRSDLLVNWSSPSPSPGEGLQLGLWPSQLLTVVWSS